MASSFQERYNKALGSCVRQKFEGKMNGEWPIEIGENPNNLLKVTTYQQACNMLSASLWFGPYYKGDDIDGFYYPGNQTIAEELKKLFEEIKKEGLPKYFDFDAELLLDNFPEENDDYYEDDEDDDYYEEDDEDDYYQENIFNVEPEDIKKVLFGKDVVENCDL